MKLIEIAALSVAKMKPFGLSPDEYREFPPRIVTAEELPQAYIEKPVRHVEVLAECAGCSRPVICVGMVIDNTIRLHDRAEHLPPHEEDCTKSTPVRMSVFRQLVFRAAEARTN